MSLVTWIAEFYPVRASQADHDPLVAAEASLLKWRGLTRANLDKHELHQQRNYIVGQKGGDDFFIDDNSCSLCCYSHILEHGPEVGDCLKNCPLGHMIDLKSTEEERKDLDEDCTCIEEFRTFLNTYDPYPMIEALEETVEMLKENKQTIKFPTKEKN